MPHMMAMAMAHMMMVVMMEHRTIRASHPPATESAEGEDPGAIITVERAGEQPADEGQHNDK